MNKTIVFLSLIFIITASALSAQSADNPGLKPILGNFGASTYASGQVTKAELDLIIQAGIRAPSARNQQPWHFTVVQNLTLAKQLIPQTTDGNVLIVVSAAGDPNTSGVLILDCALAAENMYLAAQALGLGSKLYTGPIAAVNRDHKAALGLPAGHNAIIIVRIGRLPAGVDAVSAASKRETADKKVTYR